MITRTTSRAGLRSALVAVLIAALGVGLAPAASPAPPPTPPTPPGSPAATGAMNPIDSAESLTLVTGDTVTIRGAGEKKSVDVDPGRGRRGVEMFTMHKDGDLFVYPADVIQLVRGKRVDESLFNVSELQRQHLDDDSTGSIPLLVTHRPGQAGTAGTLPAASVTTGVLGSIRGQGIAVDKDEAADFWSDLVPGPAAVRSPNHLDRGVSRLWLDQRVEADLEHSVPQIGAPAAWETGIDGDGVRVAVLDTGVDADHPDLAGKVKEQENFSTSDGVGDGFGHGTHVAATVAGTGAEPAGAPARPGVAPGAAILSGKVLSDEGYGYESDIIAGMEWAVVNDADVVNMSLGSDAGDGLDPMSRALNQLSRDSDTLFVTSAGNAGPRDYTIGSPGAADAALTVGAVDHEDMLADFSSRGPRLHDQAIKPDVVAPGVGIVAARAAGTTMGGVVDDHYTRASGTSMAAPHVAGAAAILAQRHPTLEGEALKDAVVSTALPISGDVDHYGAGRVDVARALASPVYATGNLNLGAHPAASADRVVGSVRYVNVTDEAVTLQLQLAGGSDVFTVDAESVRVPANGTARVQVEASLAGTPAGRHEAVIQASRGETVVRTLTSVAVQPPEHQVTLDPMGLDGEPETTMISITGQDRRYDVLAHASSPVTVTLGEGDYFLHASSRADVDGEEASFLVVDPDLRVEGDVTVPLDQRAATARVRIETPRPAEQVGTWGFVTHRAVGERDVSHHTNNFAATTSLWVSPTAHAKGGAFELTSRWQLQEPMLTARAPRLRGELWPHYFAFAPVITGRRSLPVVDVGTGSATEFAAPDLAGKIAFVSRPREYGGEDGYAALAEDAGAAAVLAAPYDNRLRYTDWSPLGDRMPVPSAVVTPGEAGDLRRALAGSRTLRLRLHGRPEGRDLYDVMQVSHGRVPPRIVHDVAATSARVESSYTGTGSEWVQEQRFAWRPWQEHTTIETQRDVPTSSTRTEWVSGGDTVWRQHVMPYPSWQLWSPIESGLVDGERRFDVGEEVDETWYRGVVRPAVPAQQDWMTSYRDGRVLRLRVPTFADDSQLHYGFAEPGSLGQEPDEVVTEVFEDDTLVSSGTDLWADHTVAKSAGTYRVSLRAERASSTVSAPRTSTEWQFRSEVDGPVNLLQVDYRIPTDEHNTVPARRTVPVEIRVRPSPGARLTGPVQRRLWVATRGDTGWRPVELTARSGGWFRGKVRTGDASGHLSLRVSAQDSSGSRVRQTVKKALVIPRT